MKKVFLMMIFVFSVSYGGEGGLSSSSVNLTDLTSYVIPMYSYPVGQYQSEWGKLYNLSTSKIVYVIINPNNGPGNALNANYLNAINKLKAKGFYAIGYVYTNRGNRNLEDVKKI
jgi:hypothetical protein